MTLQPHRKLLHKQKSVLTSGLELAIVPFTPVSYVGSFIFYE